MHRQFLMALLFALACLGWHASAAASGLGKFAQGTGKTTPEPCDEPDAPSGFADRARFSALAGASQIFGDEAAFSVYGDLGWRLASTTGGCLRRGGLLSSSNWWWHSLIVGVNAELIPSRVESSPFGLMLGYDVHRQSRGWLSDLANLFPIGAGISANPHRTAGEWGVGAAVWVRSVFAFRFGVDYDFERGVSHSAHVGLLDPHLFVLHLLDDS